MIRGRRREIARVPVEPGRAAVYGEGWQSWSVTETVPAAAAPYRVTAANSLAIDCQYRSAPPVGVHEGSGLLAIDPGDGAPIQVFGALSASHSVPVIQATMQDRSMVVTADGPVSQAADQDPGKLPGALGRWGTRFARGAGVLDNSLRTVPPVWCSWYQYYSSVTEEDVHENLAAMDDRGISVGVVQIDDGYEAAPGDWLIGSGQFRDLPGLVRRITATGRRAGIWIAPMLVGRSSLLYAGHPEWVVRDAETSEPVWAGDVCGQACTALDLTHPDAADYLAGVLAALSGWGIDYFKIDFVYAGAYEGRRCEAATGVEAYRHGLRLIREAIGPDALLLSCGAPILPSVGLVDAMRVGPDIAARYDPPDGNASMPSQRNAARNTTARAWQHGRFWVNDSDCLMARPGVERREEWAATVEQFGGLRSSGDAITALDDWGLETTRRLMIPSPLRPLR